MDEAEVNTLIKNNLIQETVYDDFAFKISDPHADVAMISSENPFDGFAVCDIGIVYFETKLLKQYKAFSFSLFKPHQIENLKKISNTCKRKNFENVLPIAILAVWVARKSFDLFFFHIDYITKKMLTEKSVKAKELLEFKEKGLFLPVAKKTFEVDRIRSVLIA